MKMKRMAAVLVTTATCGVAVAQCCPGDLQLRVTDPAGVAVQKAAVSMTCHTNGGNTHWAGKTDGDGKYRSPLTWEPCDVEVLALGFAAYRTTIKNAGDSGVKLDVRLLIASGGKPESTQMQPAMASNIWEYGVLVQGGPGLEERTDYSFLMAGAHLGRVLTPELGTGLLKGTFEYAVEVLPLWQSYTPQFQRLNCPTGATVASQCRQTTTGGTYRGASITPIMLRWNLTHGKRFMPWVQAAGGVLYTTRKYPGVGDLNPLDPTQTGPAADTSVWNFTPQGGIGAHYFVKPRRSVDMSVNAVHISSASLGDKNPGVNVSLQISVGYTWWK